MMYSSFCIGILMLVCTGLLLATTGDCSMEKLVRARREIRHSNVYFVVMNANVSKERLHEYVTELVELEKSKSNPGFHIELHGMVQELAHGFSAKLSEVALKEVSIYIYVYYAAFTNKIVSVDL